MNKKKILAKTQSICPECLNRLEAKHILDQDYVCMEKTCNIHGSFRTRIWKGEKAYKQWVKPKIPIARRFNMVEENLGCPFDCGLCRHHHQHTCTAVLEITENCNFSCTFCFAGSGSARQKKDLSIEHIFWLLELVYKKSPDCNLQISGGEPTLRKDLPQIIEQAVKTGFKFIQLNTNGFKLAKDRNLTKTLSNAGLSSVFLQFDGTSNRVHEQLRNKTLCAIKEQAVEQCIKNNIGVILVPTLVPGININEIGPILYFALDHAPGVRGVHFQPVSYFGRHPEEPSDKDRITIPEILFEIETQTSELFRQKSFRPSSCEHALCSFNGKFLLTKEKIPMPLAPFHTDCCTPVKAEKGASKAIDSVASHWKAPQKKEQITIHENEDGLDKFIRQSQTHIFSVSGMAFQDAWNLDLKRLKGCCIHSVAKDGRLIPFCAYNLTNIHGKGLYRKP